MARLALTPKTLPGPYPTLPPAAGSLAVTEAAPSVAGDGVSFAFVPGRTILMVRNTNAAAQTVTLTSVPDTQGRSGDVSAYSLAAGAIAFLGPFSGEGWRQADGSIYAVASHVDVKFTALQLP